MYRRMLKHAYLLHWDELFQTAPLQHISSQALCLQLNQHLPGSKHHPIENEGVSDLLISKLYKSNIIKAELYESYEKTLWIELNDLLNIFPTHGATS